MKGTRHVACIGGMSADRLLTLRQPLVRGSSNPVSSRRSRGGVARNVAEHLAQLSVDAKLVGLVGDDAEGRKLLQETAERGVDVGLVEKHPRLPTASYIAVLEPQGELYAGFADAELCDSMGRGFIENRWLQIRRAAIVFADCNLPRDTLIYLLDGCREAGLPLAIDTVSAIKARKLPLSLNGVDLLFCNRAEARALLGEDLEDEPPAMAKALCHRGARRTVLMIGAEGAVYCDANDCFEMPTAARRIANVTGAGDALIAGVLYAQLHGRDPRSSLEIGLRAASLALASPERNEPGLSAAALCEQG